MTELNYAHLCNYAFLLKEGTIGIIGIFSEIEGKTKPMVFNFTLVLNFKPYDTEQHFVKVFIKSPEGKDTMKPFEGKAKSLHEKEDAGLILNLHNIRFEEEGQYNVEILIDEKKVKILNLNVKVLT